MQFIIEVEEMDKTTAYMIENMFSDEVSLLGDLGDMGNILEYDRYAGWVKKAIYDRVRPSELCRIYKETKEEYPSAKIYIVLH